MFAYLPTSTGTGWHWVCESLTGLHGVQAGADSHQCAHHSCPPGVQGTTEKLCLLKTLVEFLCINNPVQLHTNVHVSVHTHIHTHKYSLSLVYPYGESAKIDSYKYIQQGGGGRKDVIPF